MIVEIALRFCDAKAVCQNRRGEVIEYVRQKYGKEAAEQKLSRQVPLGRLGEPNDVAYAVLYLASDESKFMTGAELKLDGGISAM